VLTAEVSNFYVVYGPEELMDDATGVISVPIRSISVHKGFEGCSNAFNVR